MAREVLLKTQLLRLDMSDQGGDKIDLEELRRLNRRAMRRLRAFVARFMAMESWEKGIQRGKESTGCATDHGNSTEKAEAEDVREKENGSK